MRHINKKRFLFFIILGAYTLTHAQTIYDQLYGNEKLTNLFEYGDAVTTGEKNMENLFKNFSLFVKNANEFNLLSYKYIDTLKDKKQAESFLEKNFNKKNRSWYTTKVIGAKEIHNDRHKYLEKSYISIKRNTEIKEKESDREQIIKTISDEYLSIGDQVYELKFSYDRKEYSYYIFINSKTNQVIKKGNLFATEVPLASMSQNQ